MQPSQNTEDTISAILESARPQQLPDREPFIAPEPPINLFMAIYNSTVNVVNSAAT
jgi:hypothetical protein